MATRNILSTIRGQQCGLEDGGALILNLRDGTQVVLDENTAGLSATGSSLLTASGTVLALSEVTAYVNLTATGTYAVTVIAT